MKSVFGSVLLAVVVLVALLGASRATDPGFYYGSWLVAVVAIGFAFAGIKSHFDEQEAKLTAHAAE